MLDSPMQRSVISIHSTMTGKQIVKLNKEESKMEQTIIYRRFEIEIINDADFGMSPDDLCDNHDAFLVYDHRDFTVQRKYYDPTDIYNQLVEKKGSNLINGAEWAFPVYAYIHSGVALSLGRSTYPFNDRWDVSFRGFAIVRRVKGWTWTRKKALEVAESVVTEWNDYLSGNIWSFSITHPDGEHCDSGGGYYGDPEKNGMIEECKASIDHCIANERKQHWSYLKTMIKSKVPLHHRTQLSI